METNQTPENNLIKLVSSVYGHTIGCDIASTYPTDSGFNGISWDNTASNSDGLDDKVKEVKRLASYNFFESENQCPSKHALEGVKRLLARDANIHDIEGWEIINGDYDMYRVISPSYTWGSLCGREYIVDLMSDTVKLISMS